MRNIRPEDLGGAVSEVLTQYHQDVIERIDAAGEVAVKDLVKRTKATAPKGVRGSFKKHIASQVVDDGAIHGKKYVWYVKAPDYRLTHLLVHGHATKNGGRTRANPFLHNAIDIVLPEYERAVEEAVSHD